MSTRGSLPDRPIYLDHHATTPVDPRVVEAMARAMLVDYGNPNSAHAFGRRAAADLRVAAGEVAALLNAEAEDVRFTGGASDALDLAVAFVEADARVVPLVVAASRIEHPALLDRLHAAERDGRMRLIWMEPDGSGRVSESEIHAALDAGPDLLCLMAANNEVGVIQPFEMAASAAQARGVPVLIDASQAAGRIAIDQQRLGADFLVLSGHKIYGPKGVGALVGPNLGLAPPPGLRQGHASTPNVPGIVGLGEACRLRRLEMDAEASRLARIRDRLQARLLEGVEGLVVNGDPARRLPHSLHVSIPGVPNDVLVDALSDHVALSTGAACMAGADAPSHVLRAMDLEAWRIEGALRLSLGRTTTEAEIETAADAIIAAVGRLRPLFRSAA